MRQYLNLPARKSAEEVAADSLLHREPGAVQLFTMVMELRVNRQSRRSFQEALDEYTKRTPARWLQLTVDVVWNMYRVALNQDVI